MSSSKRSQGSQTFHNGRTLKQASLSAASNSSLCRTSYLWNQTQISLLRRLLASPESVKQAASPSKHVYEGVLNRLRSEQSVPHT